MAKSVGETANSETGESVICVGGITVLLLFL